MFFVLLLFLSLPVSVYSRTAGAEKAPGSNAGSAWIIPIRGDIDLPMVIFVRREANKALAEGVEFIIFEIDTFGGRVDSALQITSFITSIKNARTIAWVHNSDGSMGVSWSAGALIAFSCAEIYMAAGTSLGAAAPVLAGPDGNVEAAGEKTVAAIRSQIAALAERNGHPAGLALAMVDLDVELWEVSADGRIEILTLEELERLEAVSPEGTVERLSVISPAGKLLSLTSGDARRYGLVRELADDRETLFAAIGAHGTAGESAPGFADGIVAFLNSGPVQVILILLGLVMIFLEINTPGFGIPGVVAMIAFVAVFGSGALLGRVDSLEIILFLLGIALLAVEIFVLPGFGIMGISGLVCIGLSLLFSMQDFIIPRFDWEWDLLGRNAVVVVLGILAAIAGIAVIALIGPKIRIFDRLTLQTRITGTASGPLGRSSSAVSEPVNGNSVASGSMNEGGPRDAELFPDGDAGEDYASLLGKTGRVTATLRPAGKAEVAGRTLEVESEGLFVEADSVVRVVRVRGNRVVVRRV
ncbi:MAG: nodulation protein NfeD [Spirochaetaceae bacterium]|jgi:membrane-bound serine protease (ClpP class)|nr:nodulation protein NfeD [Spirochaetaceae bacterium]